MQRLFRQNEIVIKFGLQAISAALRAQGDPHRSYQHCLIAGTNGKGSCASLLATLAQAAGRRCGLYTSPHLISFNERIRINKTRISDEALLPLLCEALELYGGDDWKSPFPSRPQRGLKAPPAPVALSYFELATLLATQHFADEGCDFAVFEVGMGGRLDATNALDPSLCLITPIGLDHQQYLGSTLKAIAAEKAAIIRPSVPAVLASRDALQVLSAQAHAVDAPAYLIDRDFSWTRESESIHFHILGNTLAFPELAHAAPFQLDNIAATLCAAQLLFELDVQHTRDAVLSSRWPGRLWALPAPLVEAFYGSTRTVLLDAAHNPHGAAALARALANNDRPLSLLINCSSDKDLESISASLMQLPMLQSIVVPPFDSPRACRPAHFCERCGLAPSHSADSLEEGLRRALDAAGEHGITLICGSIFLLGHVLQLLRADALLETL